MAGTIANLPLSQQFDKTTGKFLSGGKLYFFQANTTTPQSAYSDTLLTSVLPNPLVLDSAGRVPSFYLADGSIHARLTDKSGVVQFDEENLLVLGASAGGGGGGTTVDPTTIFQTGDTMFLQISGPRTGWVRDNARTIGSATSGATERANVDCLLLFVYLWTNFTNTQCPVSTGRGASAAADWAANKTIGLLDMRAKGPIGLDDMGNAAAGRFTGVPFTVGNATTAASFGGEATHIITTGEAPSGLITGPTVSDTRTWQVPISLASTGIDSTVNAAGGSSGVNSRQQAVSVAAGTITASFTDHGLDQAHNNMSPFALGSWYRKL